MVKKYWKSWRVSELSDSIKRKELKRIFLQLFCCEKVTIPYFCNAYQKKNLRPSKK